MLSWSREAAFAFLSFKVSRLCNFCPFWPHLARPPTLSLKPNSWKVQRSKDRKKGNWFPMKFVYLRFDKTIFGSSDNLLSSFSDKEGAFEYWGQLKRLCFSHPPIAHICHGRHNQRWCTFFKPVYFFGKENVKYWPNWANFAYFVVNLRTSLRTFYRHR